MSDDFTNYREGSRWSWGAKSNSLTLEQINIGALLRIAGATELMAKRYTDLLADRDYLALRRKELNAEVSHLKRQNAALRGHMKRLKEATGK